MNFEITLNVPVAGKVSTSCLRWSITQIYNFHNRGYIAVTLNNKLVTCDTILMNLNFYGRDSWMHITVFFLSIAMLVSNVMYLKKI